MAVKLLQLRAVAPPHGSVPATSLRLLSFDIFWLPAPFNVQFAFLYHVPHLSTSTFLDTHLPNLEHAHSLALERFYPLAGSLVVDSTAPYLRYSTGDSVTLAVVESDDDLEELASHRPKVAGRFRALVPTLPTSGKERPVLALQVTVFPDQGIAVGATSSHGAVDGSSFLHFLRTWASMCKLGVDHEAAAEDLPVYDRSIAWDSNTLRKFFLSAPLKEPEWLDACEKKKEDEPELVRATFTITAVELERLRTWVASKGRDGDGRCSSLTLAVALVWVCLLRTGEEQSTQGIEALTVPVDCRSRLSPPLSASYFGNCVTLCVVMEEKGCLVAEEGVVAAAEALREVLTGLEDVGARMEVMFKEAVRVLQLPRQPMTVAGSPRLGLYRVDFGWGRPAKCEAVHVEGHRNISIAEEGGGGGLEMGLALPPHHMRDFAHLFASILSTLSSPST